jgi:hypothetical protein
MAAIAAKIQQRAYELFQCRCCADGHSLDDWLQAERGVVQSPEAEFIEKDGKSRLRLAIAEVHFCEFGQRQLFRRLDLPAPINPDKVTATLDRGILHMVAEKTVDAANKIKAIAAA